MFQENEIIQDLASPEKSLRLLAIEICWTQGDSETVLTALNGRQLYEEDPECRQMLERAVSAVRRRLAGTGLQAIPTDPDAFLAFFASAQPGLKLESLAEISPSLVRKLVPHAVSLLEAEKDPLVSAGIVRAFGRQWPRDSVQQLANRLGAPNLSLRVAVLEALTHIAPESLQRSLPKLLMNKDPRIRTLAIRGLAKIDIEETVAHLDHLLSTGEPAAKLTAIQSCFFIPFEVVKPVLLKFLATETVPGLLQRAGVLFETNPDIEVPYRLWELIETLPSSRRDVIQPIFQGACVAIKKSGILEEPSETFINRLKEWIDRRRAASLVQTVTAAIERGEQLPAELDAAVSKALGTESGRNAFKQALEWPLTEGTKNLIREALGLTQSPTGEGAGSAAVSPSPASPRPSSTSATAASTSGPPSSGPSLVSSAKEQAVDLPQDLIGHFQSLDSLRRGRFIGFLKKEDAKRAKPLLQFVAEAKDTPPDQLAALLRAGVRLVVGEFTGLAGKSLRSEDPGLVSAAIEYQGCFDSDNFFPLLGSFLQSKNARIKGSALKVLQQYDHSQALSIVKAMLGSHQEDQREAAFACLMSFDFTLVRPILVEYLLGNPSSREIDHCMCLFQANPDPGNLYELFRLEKKLVHPETEKAAAARAANEKFLTESGQVKAADAPRRMGEYQERFRREQEKSARPLPEYSLKKLSANASPEWMETLGTWVAGAMGKIPGKVAAAGAGVFLLIVVLLIMSFGGRPPEVAAPEPQVTVTATRSVRRAAVASSGTRLEGSVEEMPPPAADLFVAQEKVNAEKNMAGRAERAAASEEVAKKLAEKSRRPDAAWGEGTPGEGEP